MLTLARARAVVPWHGRGERGGSDCFARSLGASYIELSGPVGSVARAAARVPHASVDEITAWGPHAAGTIVYVTGTAAADAPLITPASGVPCVAWEHVLNGWEPGETAGTGHWEQEHVFALTRTPFFLLDARSGVVRIEDTAIADTASGKTTAQFDFQGTPASVPLGRVECTLPSKLRGAGTSRQVIERVIPIGAPLFVTGRVRFTPALELVPVGRDAEPPFLSVTDRAPMLARLRTLARVLVGVTVLFRLLFVGIAVTP